MYEPGSKRLCPFTDTRGKSRTGVYFYIAKIYG